MHALSSALLSRFFFQSLVKRLEQAHIHFEELIYIEVPEMLDSERFPSKMYIMHRQDMLLDDPFEALAPRYLLLCLNVLGSHHANEDLEEFEANQGAVIIAVLIIFFIVCGCKSDVQDLRSKSLIVELCLRAEMMELRLANVGWITAFCNDLQKYFFEVMEVPFDNLFARNNLLLVFDYLIELPVPKVMLKAVFISYLSVLFPVAKH